MKKLKYAIITIVLLTGLIIYSFIDKTNTVYDRDLDNSEYQVIQMTGNDEILESFVSKEKSLDGIMVKLSLSEVDSNEKVSVSVIDPETNEIISYCKKNASELKNGKFNEFSFDTVEDCEDSYYIVKFTVIDKSENSVISLYRTPETYENTTLKYNGEVMDGTVVFKTITHRFDFETFIVCGALVAFIVFYMRFLYKLFK